VSVLLSSLWGVVDTGRAEPLVGKLKDGLGLSSGQHEPILRLGLTTGTLLNLPRLFVGKFLYGLSQRPCTYAN